MKHRMIALIAFLATAPMASPRSLNDSWTTLASGIPHRAGVTCCSAV